MKIVFKLYASLTAYLPPGTRGQQLEIDAPEGASPLDILKRHGVPHAHIHLVLVNGVFVPHDERDKPLTERDELAVWPPVAGG